VWEGLRQEVPFYAGLTLDTIGGLGQRWPEGAADAPAGEPKSVEASGVTDGQPTSKQSLGSPDGASAAPQSNGALRLGTYRDLWASEATERNPGLRFLLPKQTVEIAPADGERLGLKDGDEVVVSSNGDSVEAKVAMRERLRPGGAFLIEGVPEQNANLLKGAETVEIQKAGGSE
jgi:NADH-quinone oxidoreductase subunit G